MSAQIHGRLDHPRADGEGVRWSALVVDGWILFDGAIANRVDLYVDGNYHGPLRRGRERFDVARLYSVDELPEARISGFGGVIPIAEEWRGRRINVEVVAHGRQGDVWSRSVRVDIPHRPEVGPEVASPFNDELTARSQPYRALFFTHSLYLGGGQLYAQELVKRLLAAGTEVCVVSPTDGPLRAELEELGATVHLTRGYHVDADHYEGCVADLRFNIRAFAPDLVIVNTLGLFAAVDAALREDTLVAWAIHESFDLDHFIYLNWEALHPAVRERFDYCLKNALTVFEASSTLELFRPHTSEERARIIPYGIQTEEIARYCAEHTREEVREALGYGPDERVILSMGVFEHRKAQSSVVSAFARVLPLFPKARLVLVGAENTPFSEAVAQLVDDLGVGDYVRIVRTLPEIYPWYRAADFMISASDIESLPRSIIEALCFGLPTIATDVFGVCEVVTDGSNGFLCRTLDGASMEVGLYRALAMSAEEAERMRAQCQKDGAQLDGANYGEGFMELIKSAHRRRAASLPAPECGRDCGGEGEK